MTKRTLGRVLSVSSQTPKTHDKEGFEALDWSPVSNKAMTMNKPQREEMFQAMKVVDESCADDDASDGVWQCMLEDVAQAYAEDHGIEHFDSFDAFMSYLEWNGGVK